MGVGGSAVPARWVVACACAELAASLVLAPGAFGFGQVPGSPFASEERARSVAFSANGGLLALANRSKNTVSVFSVNQTSGALTAVSGSPLAVGGEPLALAFTPAGYSVPELAVTRGDGKVAVFAVNESTGALSPVPGSPFTAEGKSEGPSPLTLAFNPRQQLVAVAETNEHIVWVYEIGKTTGAWKRRAEAIHGDSPTSVSWSAEGGLLAVANGPFNTVRIFRLEGSFVETTQVYGGNPNAVAFSPVGPGGKGSGVATLAIANQSENSVSVVNFNEGNGKAFPVSGSPFGAGSSPSSVAFSPSGGLLAAANEAGNNVSLFSVDTETGALTQVPESPFAAGSSPVQAAFSPAGEAGLLAIAHASEKDVTVFASEHPPSVSAVSPSSGPTSGGTSVTITGSNFLGASAVRFGSAAAKSFTVNSATSITAVSPASASGRVDITVTTPGGSAAGGTSGTSAADWFEYEPNGPPELGQCAKVAKGSGEYSDAGCTKAKASSLYDWKSLVLTEAISGEFTPIVLETTTKQKIECRGYMTLFLEAPKGVSGGITFESCAGGCAISTNTELEGFLTVERNVAGKPPKIAMVLFAFARRNGLLWTFKCGSAITQVRGAFLVPVPSVDKMLTTFSPKWVATKGKQKPEKVEGGPTEVLETSTNGGPWEKTGLTYHPLLVLGEPMEINATR